MSSRDVIRLRRARRRLLRVRLRPQGRALRRPRRRPPRLSRLTSHSEAHSLVLEVARRDHGSSRRATTRPSLGRTIVLAVDRRRCVHGLRPDRVVAAARESDGDLSRRSRLFVVHRRAHGIEQPLDLHHGLRPRRACIHSVRGVAALAPNGSLRYALRPDLSVDRRGRHHRAGARDGAARPDSRPRVRRLPGERPC